MSYSIFGNCKGKVIDNGEAGSPLIELSPPIILGGSGLVIMQGADFGGQQVVQPITTLDDSHVLYVFGSAWTDIIIRGRALLGEASEAGANIKQITDYYEDNKITADNPKTIDISMGDDARSAYLVGMQLGAINQEFHYMDFLYICKEVPD